VSKSKINIGVDIDLPKLVDTRALIQASSGGGKSYLLRKVVESVGNSVQQIIIDPEGEFLTLREKFDFVLVSKEGDIPISLRYAETLAHRILETNVSAIIDLYEFPPHERVLFVKRFLTALVNAPKNLWHPCMIYVDEADKFAPEGKVSESVNSVINLCAQGRKRGYCAVLATQRLSKLNKDATAELLNKFIGRTGQDIDRKRAGDELGFANKQDFIGLRQLEPGEFYAFGPAISNEVLKFKVTKVVTTHPKSGSRIAVNPPTPDAIKRILNKLSDIPEEAERELETKKQLQDEVSRLKSELKKAPKQSTTHLPDNRAIESAKTEIKRQYEAVVKDRDRSIKDLRECMRQLQSQLAKIHSLSQIVKEVSSPGLALPVVIPPPKIERSVQRQSRSDSNGSSIPAGPHKMLKVLAMIGEPISKERLSMLSGYSITSSTFGIYIGKLKEFGYAQSEGNELSITDEGLKAVGAYEQLPTDPESLISFWTNKLPSGPAKMFNILTSHYPKTITRERLSEESGYSMTSSTFGIYIGKLKTLRLAVDNNKMLKAADELYN
jgi:soluble cytochrome b562